MKTKKIPTLQFKSEKSEWSWKYLKDISKKVTEKNKDNQYTETLTNSAELGIINQRDYFDKDISNQKNLNGYYIVRPDDFVYNPRISSFAPVGPIKRNKLGRTGVMSPLYYVFRTQNIDLQYLEFYFSSVKWHLYMKQNGDSGARSDRFAIKDIVFGEMPIPYPPKDIQRKIGSFFKDLDDLISRHQQELDALKQTKQGFLQKMFPAEGNVVPDTRFRNFNQDWKAYKLSDLGELFTGLSGLSKDDFSNGEHKYVTYMNVFSNTIININDLSAVDLTKKPKQNCLRKGDLLFTTSSETPQEVGMASYFGHNIDHVYLNSFCFGFRTNISKADGLFLAYFMRSNVVRNRLNKMAQGSTRYNLSKTEFRKMTINIPCLNEQIKIGEFFRQLDEVIDLKEQELEALKQTKQGFLQKMFV